MNKIQTNSSGTRSIEISEEHLQTIEDYQFFRDLIDSNGYVDEQVLDKLKLNIRAMLESEAGKDKRLLDLCLDVIYHPNMKAYGLQQLVLLYINWKDRGNNSLGMTTRAFQGKVPPRIPISRPYSSRYLPFEVSVKTYQESFTKMLS